jgi:hypothetical protein
MLLKSVLALTLSAQPILSHATDDFTVLNVSSSNPANIRIDLKVDNPLKTRPVKTRSGSFESQIDFSKIKITENNYPLSTSEGGKAIIGGCTECSVNVIHLTLDYSGSVRSQQNHLMNAARAFSNSVSKSTGRTFIRFSLFAGDKGLYNFKGSNNYYYDPDTLYKKLTTSSCSDFTLDGAQGSLTLCNSDSATRLNRAIVTNIEGLEASKAHFKSMSQNINYTSIIFSDGMGRDLDVDPITVKEKIADFKKSGGLFYAVALKSDEENKSYFINLSPTKIFSLKNVSKLSESLISVYDEMQAKLPLYFTIKICSATRGGFSTLRMTSNKFNMPKSSYEVDAIDFTGGCDMNNANQWKF